MIGQDKGEPNLTESNSTGGAIVLIEESNTRKFGVKRSEFSFYFKRYR